MEGLGSKDQSFLNKLTEIILENLRNENFGVTELAKSSGISSYSIRRKIKILTGKTVVHFIKEIRLEKSLEILQNENVTASEVAYRVGFSSPAYFSSCFHEHFGFPPGKVKNGDKSISEEILLKEPGKMKKRKASIVDSLNPILTGLLILLTLGVIIYYLADDWFAGKKKLEKILASGESIIIAIMPYQHLTPDSLRIGEIVQSMLSNILSGYPEEIEVVTQESVNGILVKGGIENLASVPSSKLLYAARKIHSDIFISGDYIRKKDSSRFYTYLTDSRNKKILKSFEDISTDEESDLLEIPYAIGKQVVDFLKISVLEKNNIEFKSVTTTKSPQAYQYYLNGKDSYYDMKYNEATYWFKKALETDTSFIWAMRFLVSSCQNAGDYKEMREWALKLYTRKGMMNECQKLYADYAYSNTFLTPNESIPVLEKILQIDDQPPVHRSLGAKYFYLQQYDKAIPELENVLRTYKKWGVKPLDYSFYSFLADSYYETGRYRKERKLLRTAENDFPDNFNIIRKQVILALTEKRTSKASKYIVKFRNLLDERSMTETGITGNLADIYYRAGLYDDAEKLIRKAIQQNPGSLILQNFLAVLLADRGKDLQEGIDIVNKILAIDPVNLRARRTKGWILYLKGNYSEALEILSDAWDTKLYMYDHQDFLRLEQVKRAVGTNNLK